MSAPLQPTQFRLEDAFGTLLAALQARPGKFLSETALIYLCFVALEIGVAEILDYIWRDADNEPYDSTWWTQFTIAWLLHHLLLPPLLACWQATYLLQFLRGKPASVHEAMFGIRHYPRMLIASSLFLILADLPWEMATIAGYVELLTPNAVLLAQAAWTIPLILISARIGLFDLFVVDRSARPSESLALSAVFSRGNYRQLLIAFSIVTAIYWILSLFYLIPSIESIYTVETVESVSEAYWYWNAQRLLEAITGYLSTISMGLILTACYLHITGQAVNDTANQPGEVTA